MSILGVMRCRSREIEEEDGAGDGLILDFGLADVSFGDSFDECETETEVVHLRIVRLEVDAGKTDNPSYR